MSVVNGIITAPVDLVGDVASILGVSTYDVAYLCGNAHGMIRKWARYKPTIPFGPDIIGTLTDDDFADASFGLTPGSSWSGLDALRQSIDSGDFASMCKWTYNPPVPEKNWCRLTDFISADGKTGYYKDATSPFGELGEMTIQIFEDDRTSLVIPASAPLAEADSDEDNVSVRLKDFTGSAHNLCEYYFGIMIVRQGNTGTWFAATTSTPFKSGDDWQINFGHLSPASYAGDWTAYPFLSSAPFAVTSDQVACTLYGIDNPGVKITLTASSTTRGITLVCGYASTSSGNVWYSLSVTNNTTSAIEMRNMFIQVATNSSGSNATRLVSFGTVTIAAHATWSAGETVATTNGSGYYNYCRLGYGSKGNPTYTAWTEMDKGSDDADA